MKIVIPGDPTPQARMRHFARGRHSHVYDPNKKDKDSYKKFLLQYFKECFADYTFPHNPKISIYFYLPIPKCMPSKLVKFAKIGLLRHRKRPDVDNFIKLYFDCMNEIVYEDDSHCSLGESDKFYHEIPKTIIYVDEADEIIDSDCNVLDSFPDSCDWLRSLSRDYRAKISKSYF